MERLYSRRKYLGGTKKFEEYEGLSKRIWEKYKKRRNKISRKEKKKAKGDRDGVKSRSRGV